jgi:hypothetical protein
VLRLVPKVVVLEVCVVRFVAVPKEVVVVYAVVVPLLVPKVVVLEVCVVRLVAVPNDVVVPNVVVRLVAVDLDSPVLRDSAVLRLVSKVVVLPVLKPVTVPK